MAKIKIRQERCKGCQLCIAWCPRKNLKTSETLNDAGVFPVVVIDEAQCTGCGMCYILCPDACIEIEG